MLPAMVDASPQLSLSISSSLFLSFDSYLSRTDTKRADGGGVSYRVRTYTLVQPVGGHVESLVCDGVFFRRCGAERTVVPGELWRREKDREKDRGFFRRVFRLRPGHGRNR
jgi:hypothetical protein